MRKTAAKNSKKPIGCENASSTVGLYAVVLHSLVNSIQFNNEFV